jgi:hypothetical protein
MAVRTFGQTQHNTVVALVFLGASLAAPQSFAGAGMMQTVVTPLSGTVTYSLEANGSTSAMPTYVGYEVQISNSGGNTINNIVFTATAAVTDSAEKATFSSADGITCATTVNPSTAPNPGVNDGTSIQCPIGQLKANASYPTFAIFFKAPVKVTNGIADGDNSDEVTISGVTYFAEGTGGVPNSIPDNSTDNWPDSPIAVTLGTCNPTNIKSALPKTGGSFFTSSGACAADPFSVGVNAPSPPTYTTVELLESDITSELACSSNDNFYTCFKAQVTIPQVVYSANSGKYLTVTLRILASDIKPGTKIGSVLIQYVDDTNPLNPVIYNITQPTRSCPTVGGQSVPTFDGIPCLAKSVYYKNKSVPGWTPEIDGAYEWQLLNDKNGGYKAF